MQPVRDRTRLSWSGVIVDSKVSLISLTAAAELTKADHTHTQTDGPAGPISLWWHMSKGKSTYLQHLEEERIKGEQEPNVCLLPPTDKKR